MHEAAEPHEDRGVALHFAFEPVEGEAEQPVIFRRPEIIHGLRNLVQNAVDFAKSDVWIDGAWGDGQIRLKIVDDGEGYPTDLIGRLGDPFLRRRRSGREQTRRPGYEGMGLGLFIAKTLLERSGATVSFRNARDPFLLDEESGARRGSMVEVTWPAAAIQIGDAEAKAPLGVNRRFPA